MALELVEMEELVVRSICRVIAIRLEPQIIPQKAQIDDALACLKFGNTCLCLILGRKGELLSQCFVTL